MQSHLEASHLNELAYDLCAVLKQRQELAQNPFEKRFIWVPHQGMASWLRHFIATEMGVAGQLHFSFPRTALWEMAQRLFPYQPLKLSALEMRLTLQNKLLFWIDNYEELALLNRYLDGRDYLILSLIHI